MIATQTGNDNRTLRSRTGTPMTHRPIPQTEATRAPTTRVDTTDHSDPPEPRTAVSTPIPTPSESVAIRAPTAATEARSSGDANTPLTGDLDPQRPPLKTTTHRAPRSSIDAGRKHGTWVPGTGSPLLRTTIPRASIASDHISSSCQARTPERKSQDASRPLPETTPPSPPPSATRGHPNSPASPRNGQERRRREDGEPEALFLPLEAPGVAASTPRVSEIVRIPSAPARNEGCARTMVYRRDKQVERGFTRERSRSPQRGRSGASTPQNLAVTAPRENPRVLLDLWGRPSNTTIWNPPDGPLAVSAPAPPRRSAPNLVGYRIPRRPRTPESQNRREHRSVLLHFRDPNEFGLEPELLEPPEPESGSFSVGQEIPWITRFYWQRRLLRHRYPGCYHLFGTMGRLGLVIRPPRLGCWGCGASSERHKYKNCPFRDRGLPPKLCVRCGMRGVQRGHCFNVRDHENPL